jgi:hypothetical protein
MKNMYRMLKGRLKNLPENIHFCPPKTAILPNPARGNLKQSTISRKEFFV